MQHDNMLHVTMFGRFSLKYNEIEIVDQSQGRSQTSLLLETMIHHRKTGVSKNLLIQTLFEDREVEDVSHSLRSAIYNAKKKLQKAGFPDVGYFRQENNIYYWTDEIETVEDADLFEQLLKEAEHISNPRTQLETYVRALHLYAAGFLLDMERTTWIVKEHKRYRELFAGCMKKIDYLATRLQLYKELYQSALYACSVEPFSEWEVYAVKALVALNQYSKAEELYNQTLNSYITHYGAESVSTMRSLINQLGKYMVYRYEDIDCIRRKLDRSESEEEGGYYCSFPIFQILFKTVSRVMERTDNNISLMLCTFVDKNGRPQTDIAQSDAVSKEFINVFVKAVRHSDTVTMYGNGQFLALLVGSNEEQCAAIQKRIQTGFRPKEKKLYLEYSVMSVIPQNQTNQFSS